MMEKMGEQKRVANNNNQFWFEEMTMYGERRMGSADKSTNFNSSPTKRINGV